MTKTALIIGITGMDGESAAHFLLSKNYKIVGTYRKNSKINLETISNSYNNSPNLFLEYCDINDFNSVRELITKSLEILGHIDEIYLLAAQSHVGNSFSSAESTVLTNGMSVYNFLENLRFLSIKTKLYFAATSELLGGDPEKCPFTEESEFECRSPYSIGKELGTRWIKYYNQTYNMFACYGVLFNHSNISREKSFFIRKVTNAAARISLGKQNKLILGNLNFYRDEHWSDFGVEMMWKMLQLPEPKTYIICRGKCFHGEEFLDESFNFFNLNWRNYVEFDKNLLRQNEVVKLVGNPQKAINDLGWQPDRLSFKKHISLMCDFDYKLENNENPARPNIFKIV